MRPKINKRRAVENALFRLGMQVRSETIVRVLAERGIHVGEAFVTAVRIELLKRTQPRPARPAERRLPAVRRHPQGFPRRGHSRPGG